MKRMDEKTRSSSIRRRKDGGIEDDIWIEEKGEVQYKSRIKMLSPFLSFRYSSLLHVRRPHMQAVQFFLQGRITLTGNEEKSFSLDSFLQTPKKMSSMF